VRPSRKRTGTGAAARKHGHWRAATRSSTLSVAVLTDEKMWGQNRCARIGRNPSLFHSRSETSQLSPRLNSASPARTTTPLIIFSFWLSHRLVKLLYVQPTQQVKNGRRLCQERETWATETDAVVASLLNPRLRLPELSRLLNTQRASSLT
jgi:hypothetical protein